MYDLQIGDARIPTDYPCPHQGCGKKLTMLAAADPPVLACSGYQHRPHESPMSYTERAEWAAGFRELESVARKLSHPMADWFEQLADWVSPQVVSEAA